MNGVKDGIRVLAGTFSVPMAMIAAGSIHPNHAITAFISGTFLFFLLALTFDPDWFLE